MAQFLTREHIESFRRARLTRDARQIEPFIDDDVDWFATGPIELLQFCGHRIGKAAVLECITRLEPSALKVLRSELTTLLIDGDRAAFLGRIVAVQPGTGRTITYNQVQFMRFRNGKIVEYRAIMDTLDAAEQMIGHPLALPEQPEAPELGGRVAV